MDSVSVIIPNADSGLIGDILAGLRCQTVPMDAAEILVVGHDAVGLVDEDELVRLSPTTGRLVTLARSVDSRLCLRQITAISLNKH